MYHPLILVINGAASLFVKVLSCVGKFTAHAFHLHARGPSVCATAAL